MKDLFLEILNKLEGYKTKCKNLHWAAEKMNTHKLLDEFLSVISDYQDSIAEEIMGIRGEHLNPNDIKPITDNSEDPYQFVKKLTADILSFRKNIPDKVIYEGMRSECDTFIHNLAKYNYLFSLCDVHS